MNTQTEDAPGLGSPSSPLCWFPWYPKDWLTSDAVGRMSDAQEVSYFRLLNRQWLGLNGLLPDDLGILSKYAGHDMSTEAMLPVLLRFPVVETGSRANSKLLRIYHEQQEKHARRVRAGNAGSIARCNTTSIASGTMASGSGSVSVSVSASDTSSKESDFNAFWTSYPRKVGRKAALKAWGNAKDKPELPAILAAVESQSKSEQWKKEGGQFIPYPATWINQGRWGDVLPPPPYRGRV